MEPLYDNVLPAYYIDKGSYDAGFKSIADFASPEAAERFDVDLDGKADLIGCQPGWGCELVIEHHMDVYELRDHVNHLQGEYAVMLADVISRAENGLPTAYYAWRPHWVHHVLKLGELVERLEVPFTSVVNRPDVTEEDTTFDGKNIGHLPWSRNILANRQFLDENPAARKLFEVMRIRMEDVEAQNLLIYQGEKQPEDIERHVSDWITANRETFDGWLKAARDEAAKAN